MTAGDETRKEKTMNDQRRAGPGSVPDDALAAALAAVVANTTGYAALVGGIVRTAVEAAAPLIRAAEARALVELLGDRASAVPLYPDGVSAERRGTFMDCADSARDRAEQLERGRG